MGNEVCRMTSVLERETEPGRRNDVPAGDRTAILGIGGAGCRIVRRIAQQIAQRNQNTDVNLFLMDSDKKELELLLESESAGPVRELCFDRSLGHIFAAKAGASLGEQDSFAGVISGYGLVLVVAGLGKETDGGLEKEAGGGLEKEAGGQAALRVCDFLKDKETLTVVFAVLPSRFEEVCQSSLDYLKRIAGPADAVLITENDRVGKDRDAHRAADETVLHAVLMLIDSMNEENLMSLNVPALKALFRKAGLGCVFAASSGGRQRDTALADQIRSRFLAAGKPFEKTGGVMALISGPLDLKLLEVNTIAQALAEHIDPQADVLCNAIVDESRDGVEAVFS